MSDRVKETLTVVLTVALLAFSYIGLGFGAVSGSPTPTEVMAYATIDDSQSPFTKDQLVKGAVATQDYSFNLHDLEEYMNVISEMNKEAATPYAEYTQGELLNAPVQYSITQDEINHLNDVYDVSEKVTYPLLTIVFLALVMLFIGYRFFGMPALSASFLWGGIVTLAVIAALLICGMISFDGLFAIFHSLFFAEGSWTFPADSLLITMLPQDFWIGIGAIWIGISAALSIISIIAGVVLGRVGRNH